MDKKYSVAIVGATGAVGGELLKILKERDFPISSIQAFASRNSEGRFVMFDEEPIRVSAVDDADFEGIDIAFFTAGATVSDIYAKKAAEKGVYVIDNTSRFRMDEGVPLVVPEVNPDDIELAKRGRIIANPNCSTIQMVIPLMVIHRNFGLKSVRVATYQSVSGKGARAMEELFEQTRAAYGSMEMKKEVFEHQIAFNCIPKIDVFLEDGYTKEERKMLNETRKILHLPDLRVSATAVRVPVFYCHAEAVWAETEKEVELDRLRAALSETDGVVVRDNPAKGEYPLQVDCAGTDSVFVGRIRKDTASEWGVCLWIVADNLRKGAALNSVQIAELLIERRML